MNILVVDDNASARTFVRRCVETIPGARVLEAGSVGEALEKSGDADLVLLDWLLDNQSGAAFLKPFREHEKKVPVLVISGRSDKETVAAAIQSGANGYIRKPFTPEVLLEKISSHTDHSRFTENSKITDFEYFLRLAKSKIVEKDHAAALRYLTKAIQAEPHLPGLYKMRADVFAAMGRYADAEKDWKRAE